jgi:predicted GNAT superfamily acetyltransferase
VRYAAKPKIPSKTVVPPPPTGEISVRHCHSLAEFAACIEVERAVWRSSDVDVVPLPLFVIAAEIGGQVLGAFDGDRMVGFTLAFPGVRKRRPFLHSHMTGVLAPYWNRGIARRLKLFQREDALSRKIEHIEWTFDPLQVKNAYFNLVRLGAIVRRYLPNLYGTTTSPLHSGLPTDRLLAEWPLRSARVRRAVSSVSSGPGAGKNLKNSPARARESVRVRVPPGIAELARNQPDDATRVQAEIRQEFEHWFGRGYAATSLELDAEGGAYELRPWPKDEA